MASDCLPSNARKSEIFAGEYSESYVFTYHKKITICRTKCVVYDVNLIERFEGITVQLYFDTSFEDVITALWDVYISMLLKINFNESYKIGQNGVIVKIDTGSSRIFTISSGLEEYGFESVICSSKYEFFRFCKILHESLLYGLASQRETRKFLSEYAHSLTKSYSYHTALCPFLDGWKDMDENQKSTSIIFHVPDVTFSLANCKDLIDRFSNFIKFYINLSLINGHYDHMTRTLRTVFHKFVETSRDIGNIFDKRTFSHSTNIAFFRSKWPKFRGLNW